MLDGPGIEDNGRYEAKALGRHKLKIAQVDSSGERSIPIWLPRSRQDEAARLPESPMWETEKELLRTDPDMYYYMFEEPQRKNRDDPKRNV